MPRPNWEKEHFCSLDSTDTLWGIHNKRLEQPPTALSCAKDSVGSRMEADPRAEAASHPNAVFDWTQQSRHHCCVSQPSARPCLCASLLWHLNVLYSNLSLPWSPAPKASLSKMVWRRVQKFFLSSAWRFLIYKGCCISPVCVWLSHFPGLC